MSYHKCFSNIYLYVYVSLKKTTYSKETQGNHGEEPCKSVAKTLWKTNAKKEWGNLIQKAMQKCWAKHNDSKNFISICKWQLLYIKLVHIGNKNSKLWQSFTITIGRKPYHCLLDEQTDLCPYNYKKLGLFILKLILKKYLHKFPSRNIELNVRLLSYIRC